jgi:hypothetical protein
MVFEANSVNIIALILIIVALIKTIVIVINKKVWLNGVGKPIYKNPVVSSIVYIILILVAGYYLLQSYNIVEILAIGALYSLFIGLAFLMYGKDTFEWAQKIYNKPFSGWMILYIIAWLAILVWGLYVMFG